MVKGNVFTLGIMVSVRKRLSLKPNREMKVADYWHCGFVKVCYYFSQHIADLGLSNNYANSKHFAVSVTCAVCLSLVGQELKFPCVFCFLSLSKCLMKSTFVLKISISPMRLDSPKEELPPIKMFHCIQISEVLRVLTTLSDGVCLVLV